MYVGGTIHTKQSTCLVWPAGRDSPPRSLALPLVVVRVAAYAGQAMLDPVTESLGKEKLEVGTRRGAECVRAPQRRLQATAPSAASASCKITHTHHDTVQAAGGRGSSAAAAGSRHES